MRVQITDIPAYQAAPLGKAQNFGVGSYGGLRQALQQWNDFGTVFEVAAGQLADDERVRQHLLFC